MAFKWMEGEAEQHQSAFRFSATFQLWTVVGLLFLFLYAALFSTYPPVHDLFHEARHALGFIACH